MTKTNKTMEDLIVNETGLKMGLDWILIKDSEGNVIFRISRTDYSSDNDAIKSAHHLVSLLKQNAELLEALKEVRKLIDDNDLVRNISKDHDDDDRYFLDQSLRILSTLRKVVAAIKKAES